MSTPMNPHAQLDYRPDEPGLSEHEKERYRSAIGAWHEA